MGGFMLQSRLRKSVVILGGTAALILASVTTAGAHGGDTSLVHSCVSKKDGSLRIVGANHGCSKGETPLDWSRDGAGSTTYTAGPGLTLNGTEFSVTGAPWSGLTGVPTGFADGTDDVDGGTAASAPWTGLTGVPTGFADGTDDVDGGTAASLSCTTCISNGEIAVGAVVPDKVSANAANGSGGGAVAAATPTDVATVVMTLSSLGSETHKVLLTGQAQVSCPTCTTATDLLSYQLFANGVALGPAY